VGALVVGREVGELVGTLTPFGTFCDVLNLSLRPLLAALWSAVTTGCVPKMQHKPNMKIRIARLPAVFPVV
jgi:hypothetical protein